ncbi:hypothetical protein D915_006429 [Fasciola hepatica]|uniref:BTB domain-containing protein n=1 Tax=Fasciola hepatica TaxID=6192 RepID=A0A4E0R9M7_FASHE|nr:hypothetical protein D915_006429 [Fasciola hepatica]
MCVGLMEVAENSETTATSNVNGTLVNPTCATDLLAKLNEQRVNGTECDFYLVSGELRCPVHRCLFRALSPVIDEAVRASTGDSQSTSYDLISVSEDSLDQLISYVYTSQITLSPQTAIELHTVAVQLQISFLDQVTMDFMRDCINADTCISILNHALAHNCFSLRAECILFCATNYEEVNQKSEFEQLQPAEFLEIVTHPDLQIDDESVLFESIKSWLAVAPFDRAQYATQLSECVRFQLFQVDRLLDLLQDPQNALFHVQIRKALIEFGALARPIAMQKWERKPKEQKPDPVPQLPVNPLPVGNCTEGGLESTDPGRTPQSQPQSEPQPHPQSQLSSSPESPRSTEEESVKSVHVPSYILTILGGRSPEKKLLRDVLCYRVEETDSTDSDQMNIEIKLLELSNPRALPNARKGFGAASIWNQVFLIGGQPATSLQTVDVYDVHEDEWLIGPPLRNGRAWHGVAHSVDVLFAVGGTGRGGIILTDGEMLDLRAGEWLPIPPMTQPRMSLACCVADDNLYAVGGLNQLTTEALDLRAWKWRTVLTLDVAREAPGVGQYEEAIYIFGGATANGPLNSTIQFNPTTGKLVNMRPMSKACAFSAFATREEYVFVVGGRDANESLAIIQLYDMKNDQWAVLSETLPIARSSSCALILTDV